MVYRVDPLRDKRWSGLLERHPRASIFHTSGWLTALQRTYGYEPVVYTTCPPAAELQDGWVFCRVHSWLTGRRIVSLPFVDHCEPLVDSAETLQALAQALQSDGLQSRWKYIEARPWSALPAIPGFETAQEYWLHRLDLRPGLESLFRNLHDTSVRRKIRRAEREGLLYEEGRADSLLDKFYQLLQLTRRRHQVPPQPRAWFENLISCLGERLKIRVASRGSTPIAAILTLQFQNTVVYKYGASDARFHSLGGMHLLLWTAIRDATLAGVLDFDLGRSDLDNAGLIVFKNRWGAVASKLSYSRSPSPAGHRTVPFPGAKRVLAFMPQRLLTLTGKLVYKHVA